jgi:hypothetical protein
MKKKFFVIFAILGIFFITGCTETETVSKDTSGNDKKEFSINETAVVNNTKISINSVKKIYSECSWEYDGECYSTTEPDNDYFLIIDLTLENIGDDEISVSSLIQFDLKMPNGEKANQEYMLDAIKSSLDGSIMSNDLLKGQIAFDVTDEDYYYFYYQDSILDDNIKFVINRSDIVE